jgi:beta-lactam-binding protein with PASTA domain
MPDSQATAAAPDSVVTPAGDTVLVPSVIDLEEGTARNAILDAGLQVGEVQFQASAKPAGTVLATSPVSGARVPMLTAVSLVLSDGRPPTDGVGETDSLRRSSPHPIP